MQSSRPLPTIPTRSSRARPVSLARGGLASGFRLFVSREMWVATAFLLLNYLLGVFWFAALFILVPLGVTLAYTIVGLLVLALTMRLWMVGANLERARVAIFFGVHIPSPYRPLPERDRIGRALARAGDPAVWRDLLYLVLLFPLGVIQGTLLIAAWGLILGGVAFIAHLPIYLSTTSAPLETKSLHTVGTLLSVVVWLAVAVLLPRLAIAAAGAHVRLARLLLGPTRSREALLAERVDELRESRSRLLDTALLERQRIERDLHDGAQQRLVAVALDLGLAREKMRSDPDAAAALVEEAHEQTKKAIRDIRDLVRGIHPAVLSERGLDPAISALAGRSSVPVAVNVELDHRLPEDVESAAYFVVSEALTNVTKHSNATRAWVHVGCADGRLTIEVGDDGSGGATPTAGTGLAGLADRVAALDGRLVVESPAGGPTRIKAELPCE